MTQKIKVKRTITVVTEEPMSSYPEMTVEDALAWERDQYRSEKIQAFVEALQFTDSENIEISEVVTVEEE